MTNTELTPDQLKAVAGGVQMGRDGKSCTEWPRDPRPYTGEDALKDFGLPKHEQRKCRIMSAF